MHFTSHLQSSEERNKKITFRKRTTNFDVVVSVVLHGFLWMEIYFHNHKFWALNYDCMQVLLRNFTGGWVHVGSWEKRVAVVESEFWWINFQSGELLLLYTFYRFIPASYGKLSVFLVKTTWFSIYGRCFVLYRPGASFNFILFFNLLFTVISPDNLSPYQGLCSN